MLSTGRPPALPRLPHPPSPVAGPGPHAPQLPPPCHRAVRGRGGGGQQPSPASQVIQDTSKGKNRPVPLPAVPGKRQSYSPSTGRLGRGLTSTVQLPPKALLLHDRAGSKKKKGSSSSIHGPFLPPFAGVPKP